MKSRPWINQWRIHLLGLITHEALHVSTPICPGSWEKEKHLSTKLCPSTFSFSLCEKQPTFEDKLTQEHREDPPHGHNTRGTLPANHHHPLPPFFPLSSSSWPLTLSMERLRQSEGKECSVAVQLKVGQWQRDQPSKCTTMAPLWHPLKDSHTRPRETVLAVNILLFKHEEILCCIFSTKIKQFA